MAISNEIEYADIEDLFLDPLNPRLGRNNTGPKVPQEKILELMQDWTLDELAISFLESGFWPQEALLVVEEPLYGKKRLVVVEGNRRLVALKFLQRAIQGSPKSPKWGEMAKTKEAPKELFARIPYIKIGSRQEIESFLGFRRVTGIKEWKPAEKAEYIAKLIEHSGMSYVDVMRRIGSKTSVVRQHYISYRLLLQMEDQEEISMKRVEDKFSVLYLSLRSAGTQKYLHINITAEPEEARQPVPKTRLEALKRFAMRLFGDDNRLPLFTDSRQVDDFGRILESSKAVQYLERSDSPNFEVAFRTAGGDEPELLKLIATAADNIELALRKARLHRKSERIQWAVERCGADVRKLLRVVPPLRDFFNHVRLGRITVNARPPFPRRVRGSECPTICRMIPHMKRAARSKPTLLFPCSISMRAARTEAVPLTADRAGLCRLARLAASDHGQQLSDDRLDAQEVEGLF